LWRKKALWRFKVGKRRAAIDGVLSGESKIHVSESSVGRGKENLWLLSINISRN
jgi:hypothetical protein